MSESLESPAINTPSTGQETPQVSDVIDNSIANVAIGAFSTDRGMLTNARTAVEMIKHRPRAMEGIWGHDPHRGLKVGKTPVGALRVMIKQGLLACFHLHPGAAGYQDIDADDVLVLDHDALPFAVAHSGELPATPTPVRFLFRHINAALDQGDANVDRVEAELRRQQAEKEERSRLAEEEAAARAEARAEAERRRREQQEAMDRQKQATKDREKAFIERLATEGVAATDELRAERVKETADLFAKKVAQIEADIARRAIPANEGLKRIQALKEAYAKNNPGTPDAGTAT